MFPEIAVGVNSRCLEAEVLLRLDIGRSRGTVGRMRAGLALAGCLLLTACGAGGGPNGSAPSPKAVTSSSTVEKFNKTNTGNDSKPTFRGIDAISWRDEIGFLSELRADTTKQAITDLGPWVTVRDGGAQGYLDDRNVIAADLSGDGRKEVVVPLLAGAGGPGTGILVFTPTENHPELVGDAAFYGTFGFDTRASVENGELVVRHSIGAGWEPACCWSGEVIRRFRTNAAVLVETTPALESGNPVAKGFTVDRFYGLIGARNTEAAYALLTDAERARMGASRWPELFAQGDEVAVSMLSTPRSDGLLPFRLLISSGGRVQAWQGGAALIYNTPTHSWLIDLLSLQPESV